MRGEQKSIWYASTVLLYFYLGFSALQQRIMANPPPCDAPNGDADPNTDKLGKEVDILVSLSRYMLRPIGSKEAMPSWAKSSTIIRHAMRGRKFFQ